VLLVGWTLRRASGWLGLALACAVGLLILGAFRFAPHTGPHAETAYVNTVYPAVTK
jgi:hypothetical protein